MSQSDFQVDSGDGFSVRADINAAIQALASNNAGPTEPPVKYAGMWWPDTTTGMMKQRNTGNTGWIDRWPIDQTVSNTPFENLLINGNFQINQLGVSGTVTLTAGQYGHDGFKAGASGWTYTFSTAGGITTINTTAGNPVQVVNGKYLQSGPMVLGWGGTAQARIDGGTYAASPIAGTAVAGVNQTIEWGLGTLKLAQYEPGTTPSAFKHRDDELFRCQEYAVKINLSAGFFIDAYQSVASAYHKTVIALPRRMNSLPVASVAGTAFTSTNVSTYALTAIDPHLVMFEMRCAAAGRFYTQAQAGSYFLIQSRL